MSRENQDKAIENTAQNSGSALLGSALSTITGFLVIGLAPMTMFASLGVLSAIMIFMAFVAALLVLPSLLRVITKSRRD